MILTRWAIRAGLAALAFTACSDATDPARTTRLSVLLTDDPGDVVQAFVTIDRIELAGSGGFVLRDAPWTGDLLGLANQTESLVADVAVPEGTYAQLRFVVGAACIAVEGPTATETYSSDAAFASWCDQGAPAGALQMPSLPETGIKVKAPFTVEGEQQIILVDFDVAESFGRLAGGSGQWVLHPVVHASEIGLSGGISVQVELAAGVEFPDDLGFEDFTAELDGTETEALDEGGSTTFAFLVPSDSPFSLDLLAPAGYTIVTDPTLPAAVDVGSGEVVSVTITITEITRI